MMRTMMAAMVVAGLMAATGCEREPEAQAPAADEIQADEQVVDHDAQARETINADNVERRLDELESEIEADLE